MSIDNLNMHMTVMHLDNNNSMSSAKSGGSYKQSSEQDRKKTDEEFKQYTGEGPVIKGNKQLSVEVKLSDLVRYGALGQGASGYVEKAVHRPTKKIIALKVIPL